MIYRQNEHFRSLSIDSASLHETKQHGQVVFPVEILHDHLDGFKERHIPCHWHDEWEFSIVKQGAAIFHINGISHALTKGNGIFINSGTTHMVLPKGTEPVILLTIIVHPRFIYGTPESLPAQKYIHPFASAPSLSGILLNEHREKDILDCCFQLDKIFCEKPFAYELAVKSLFCQLAFLLISASKDTILQSENSLNSSRVRRILDYIHENYAEKISLARLADLIMVSRETCSRIFRKQMGMTITGYLEDYRVMQSLTLLEDGRYTILQVAFMTGFSNASRYTKAFRSKMKCSPSEYCKNIR